MIQSFRHFVLLSVILAGCSPTGRVTQITFDNDAGKTTDVALSEYFEAKAMIAEGQIKAHLIVTLGAERLPKGYVLAEKVNRFQDQIEEVTEIYFSNEGDKPVTIGSVLLEERSQNKLEILPNPITVMPGKWVKSEPIIRVSSIYRPNINSVLHYEFEGATYTADLPQVRTPVKDLPRR